MSIERDEKIRFHELGTLTSVTRWIRTHDEGVAEWLKNARRAYQQDRANVAEEHRTAVLLFKDADTKGPARIGILDVGGASLEDVTSWSTWQDPDASSRGSGVDEEITQGNGGKAYMVRLFRGPARITAAGLSEASMLRPSDTIGREKADRQLEQAVKQIIEHPVFKDWLKDSTRPKYFREAGHFWGIAPSTPAKTALERIVSVERTLKTALKALDERGVSEFIEQRGKILFERNDIERCVEFQRVLTERFKTDLKLLAPDFEN